MIATNSQDSTGENQGFPMITTKTISSLKETDLMTQHQDHLFIKTLAKAADKSQNSSYQGEPKIQRDKRCSTETEMDVGEEASVGQCPSGVVAGSPIPAGVSLGDWPEESILLGADLLPHRASLSGSAWTSASSKLGLLEVIWDNGQVKVQEETSRTPAATIAGCMKSALDRHEQNVEVCREGDRLRVLTLRAICKGEQLCVWYGDHLAREVGVPFLTTASIRGSNEYACTACDSLFVYPNALKAHMLLQCSETQSSFKANKTPVHPLVPFDRLLHRLNKSSEASKHNREALSPDYKSYKIVPGRKVEKRRCSRKDSRQYHHEHCPQKDDEVFLKAAWTHEEKLCGKSSRQDGKLQEDRSAFRKPRTSRGISLSHDLGTWCSSTPSSSLTLSLAPFPSSPPDDDSMKMSPDSSTDQNSALNLSVRISPAGSTESSIPVAEQSPSDLLRKQFQPIAQPPFANLSHWKGPVASNNILAQSFASLPAHTFDTAHAATANIYLPNILPLAHASFLAEQYYKRYHLHRQYTPMEAIDSIKQHMFPPTNYGLIPFNSFQGDQRCQQSPPFKRMDEMQGHHHSQRCRPQQNHHHHQNQQQQQPQRQQKQQHQNLHPASKIQLNKPLVSSGCPTASLVRPKPVCPSLPTSPQSQHRRSQPTQPHQVPQTQCSNIYGLTLPSDKEPLDLLPQAYFANKSKKGHLCIYCGKVYSRKYGLKIHMRTHNGYKPLKCKICSRPFGDPSNLNKHVRLHAQGETPYRCDYCGKVLVRRRDLERHIKSRHPTGECRVNTGDIDADDWEEEKRDEEGDEIIDVASVDEEPQRSETDLSSCRSPVDV